MRARIARPAAAILLLLGASAAHADTITFASVVDSTTINPVTGAPFGGGFQPPVIDGADVAFLQYGGRRNGVFLRGPGGLVSVLDSATSAYTPQASPGLGGGVVSAYAVTGGPTAILAGSGGPVQTIATSGLTLSGRTLGGFDGSGVVESGGSVVFGGEFGAAFPNGLYRSSGGTISTVVAPGSTIAGRTLRQLSSPSADAGAVVFVGQTLQGRSAIYRADASGVSLVIDDTAAVPGAPGVGLTSLGDPVLRGGSLAFLSGESNSGYGAFAIRGGALTTIADTSTVAPDLGAGKTFTFIAGVGIDGGLAAFVGDHEVDQETPDPFDPFGPPDIQVLEFDEGLYVSEGGAIAKVLALNDSLFGHVIDRFNLSSESVSGNQVVFEAEFTDGTSGIYTATIPAPADVPEPGAAGLALLAAGVLSRRRSGRREAERRRGGLARAPTGVT